MANTYEEEVEKLLLEKNIPFNSQVNIGLKRNGGKHFIDFLIEKTLVSLKSQKVNGTAEEKIPFEIMKLQQAVDDYNYDNAVLVLSGDSGWSWKDYYLSKEFKDLMYSIYPDVSILEHKQFSAIYLE